MMMKIFKKKIICVHKIKNQSKKTAELFKTYFLISIPRLSKNTKKKYMKVRKRKHAEFG